MSVAIEKQLIIDGRQFCHEIGEDIEWDIET